MKKLLSIVLLLSFSVITYGQDEASLGQHQFSINASTFVKNFLSFNSNTLPTTPYQVMYRNIRPSGNALRVVLGAQYFQSTNQDDQGDDKTLFTSSSIQSAVGFEKRTSISNRWLYYFGAQGLFNYESDVAKNISGDFNSTNKNIAYSVGIGGVAGVQFNFNDRISLGTEGGLPLLYTTSKSTSQFDSELSFDKTEVLSLIPSLPTFLYFNINLK